MPQLHQFSQPTKSKSRGSVALLSIVWLAITCVGVVAICRATSLVHQRSLLQTHADAVALAASDHGDTVARAFAQSLNVRVVSLTRDSSTVTVRVSANQHIASATALRPM